MRTVWREIQVQKTAAKMANFRVDVLLKTLDELQKGTKEEVVKYPTHLSFSILDKLFFKFYWGREEPE